MRLHPLHPLIRYLIWRVSTSFLQATAVHPDQNRGFLHSRLLGRPNIQEKTVFTLWILALEFGNKLPEKTSVVSAPLEANGLIFARIVVSCIVNCSLWWHESLRSNRRLAVADSEPLLHVGYRDIHKSGVDPASGDSS
jgi:hypothetical protein